jgi:epidermal growth factor receptor substrate 15
MKTIIFISALLFSFIGVCQDFTFNFKGQITNSDTGEKPEAGVTVNCVVGGKVIGTTTTGSNGSYKLTAVGPVGSLFTVVFSKPGLVSKRVEFNTAKLNPEDMIAGGKQDFSLPGVLFAERPGVDLSFLNTEPVAISNWDPETGKFEFDMAAIAKTKKKINDALGAAGNVDAANTAKYQAAIGAGANLLSQKKYEEALAKYEEATALKPKEQLPVAKINEIEKLIAEKEKNEAAGQQADLEYKNLIAAADNLRDQKKNTEAIAKYNEAIKKKDEAYPKGEIAKINAAIKAAADKAAADKAAADKAVADKLAADKAAADKLAADKLAAANKLAADKLTADKLAADKAAADKLAADKAASDKVEASKIAAQNAKKAKIDKLILDGNTLFGKGDLNGAKLKFEEVLREDALNAVAIAKLKEINGKLDAAKGQAQKDAEFNALKKEGMGLAISKKYKEAKIKLTQASDMKPDAEVTAKITEIDKILKDNEDKASVDEGYKKIVAEASALESSKNYDGAIAKYKEALVKKPTEVLPKNKITELEKLKASLASQGDAEAKKTALYNENMAKGAKSFSDKKYTQALTDFQSALSVKPNDAAAKAKISETQQIMDDLENANSQDAEAKKKFNKLVEDGDKLFKVGKYLDAKMMYEKALVIESSNAALLKKVSECDRLEKEKSLLVEDSSYRKIIGAADKNFSEKDYLKAREYYERAVKFKENDPYPRAKLLEIDAILNPKAVAAATNAEPEKLLPLGIPLEKDDIDALAALKQAEIQRKVVKDNKVKEKKEGANEVFTEYSDDKNKDHYDNVAKVEEIKTSINNEVSSNVSDHTAVISLVEDVTKLQDDKNSSDVAFEKGEVLNNDDKLGVVKAENSESFQDRNLGYKDNVEIIKKNDLLLAENGVEREIDKKELLIETHQNSLNVENEIIEKQKDDLVSRAEFEVEMKKSTDITRDEMENRIVKSSDQGLEVKSKIEDVQADLVVVVDVDQDNATELSNNLEVVKRDLNSEEKEAITKDVSEGMDQTAKMVDLNKELNEEASVKKGNQQNSNEKLKLNNKSIIEENVASYNDEMIKYLANQNELKGKTNGAEALTAVSNEKLTANNSLLIDRSKELQDGTSEQNKTASQKLLESTKEIHDKQKSQVIVKPIIANSVGKEYPEGVSQESFTQNDENGLMKAVITRRVVVIQGKGDVYVKTQTLQAITYSKNDSPTTERVWQKETQGPHLVKNY